MDLMQEYVDTINKGLLSVSGENRYVYTEKDLLDIIQEKCGYEVTMCVRTIFERSKELYLSEQSMQERESISESLTELLDTIDLTKSPILKVKALSKCKEAIYAAVNLLLEGIY